MRRDHFTLTAEETAPESAGEPTLRVAYDGPDGNLTARLEDETGTVPDGSDIDATFRLRTSLDAEEPTGVFSLTHRLTGEYLLEANAEATDIFAVVDAVREADDSAYSVRIERPESAAVVRTLETLLVYDDEGELNRQHSLLPGGVEL